MNSDVFPEGFKYACHRCSGSGYLPQYSHIQSGVCFACNGQGKYVNEAHKKEFGSRSNSWYHINLGCVEFEFKAISGKQAESKMKNIINIKRKLKQYEHINWANPILNSGRKSSNYHPTPQKTFKVSKC